MLCGFLRSKKSLSFSESLHTADKTEALRRGNALKLIQSHLSNKKSTFKGEQQSSIKLIIAGVPQGSILGSLFFLLFINDLPNSNLMKIILFLDDTVLVQSDNNLEKLQNFVNCEMTKVIDWLTANKLTLTISKTKYMLITNRYETHIP